MRTRHCISWIPKLRYALIVNCTITEALGYILYPVTGNELRIHLMQSTVWMLLRTLLM